MKTYHLTISTATKDYDRRIDAESLTDAKEQAIEVLHNMKLLALAETMELSYWIADAWICKHYDRASQKWSN